MADRHGLFVVGVDQAETGSGRGAAPASAEPHLV